MGLFKMLGKLNPAQRARKYANELKTGYETSVNGKIYTNEYGEPYKLTRCQKAHRSGYLAARRDNAAAWKAKQAKKAKRATRAKQVKTIKVVNGNEIKW